MPHIPRRPSCEGHTSQVSTDAYGFVPVRCHRQRGLTFWPDVDGTVRWSCSTHRAQVERLHPRAAAVSESEMRALWGDR